MHKLPRQRILSVCVQSSCIGYAVLEDRTLLEWQVICAHTTDIEERRNAVHKLITKFEPSHVALEKCTSPDFMKGPPALRLIQILANDLKVLGVELVSVTAPQLREALGLPLRANKYEVALTLSNHFRELERSLPRKHKIWEAEDKRIAMFVAVGVGLSCN